MENGCYSGLTAGSGRLQSNRADSPDCGGNRAGDCAGVDGRGTVPGGGVVLRGRVRAGMVSGVGMTEAMEANRGRLQILGICDAR